MNEQDARERSGLMSRARTFLASGGAARAALVTACVVLIGYWCVVSVMMAFLPAPLNFVEGKVLCDAYEFAVGNRIYRDPGVNGAATGYPPLYLMLLGGMLRVSGPSFLWGRLISLAASALTAILLGSVFLRRSPEGRLTALVVATLVLSAAWNTRWFCAVVRADSLSHLFWTGALVMLLGRRHAAVYGSAVLLVLAFLTKQTTALAVPGAILYLFMARRSDLVGFLAAGAVAFVAFFLLLSWVAGDWMSFYVFKCAAGVVGGSWGSLSLSKLASTVFSIRNAPLTLACGIAAIVWWRDLQRDSAYRLALLCLPFLVGGSCLAAIPEGSGDYAMLPSYYALAFLAGFAVERILAAPREKTNWALWLLAGLLFFQFDGNALYHFSQARGRFSGNFKQLVEFLKRQDGTMYAPSNNVVTLLAGRHEYDDWTRAREIRLLTGAAEKRILEKINSCRYDWLICQKWVGAMDMNLLAEDPRSRYSVVLDIEDWTVLRKTQ